MNMRILLVDDDRGPMDYFVDALRHRGYLVEHIVTVDAFFDRLDRAPIPPDFDLAIIDMMMPHGERLTREATDGGLKSGIAVAQAIRQKYPLLPTEAGLVGVGHVKAIREKYPAVPIVVLSNYTDSDVLALLPPDVHCKAKFETSPFEFADFIQTLIPTTP